MEYAIAVKTDVGIERISNQDSLYVRTASYGEKKYAFAVVCDGMGGLSEGDYASRLVIEAMSSWFETEFIVWLNGGSREDILCVIWKKLLDRCNTALLRYGDEKRISLGTTATALLLGPERYAIVHIGDTRAYELHRKLRQLTHDHTLASQMVESGTLSREEAAFSRESHILTRCIGVESEIQPDFLFGETKVDTVYLLCSDGFRNQLEMQEIEDSFQPIKNYDAERLLYTCEYLLKTSKEREESDNLSIIAIRTIQDSADVPAESDQTCVLE